MNATVTIAVRRFTTGAKDRHGNATTGHLEPQDVQVFAVYPTVSDEAQVGRSDVTEGLTVLAPTGTEIGPHDVVLWLGDPYEVNGEPGDWSHGPFGWAPGVAFNLKRTEG